MAEEIKNILQKACDFFELGKLQTVHTIDEGVLNINYKINTDTGNFFVKIVRNKKQESLDKIMQVEKYMHDSGIPAIAMISNPEGKFCVDIGGMCVTIYPFIESDRTHMYRESDYFSMGQMLARIHLVSKENIPAIELDEMKKHTASAIIETLDTYKEKIKSLSQKTDIDILFLSYIDMKLEILKQIDDSIGMTQYQYHILHGDYHTGNLLIDASSRNIIGICDWEKSEKGSRAYEIARTALLLFEDFEADVHLYKKFIEGYKSVYPIGDIELKDGFIFRLKSLAKAKWIENKHYDMNDLRSDKFVEIEIKRLDFFKPLLLNGSEEFFKKIM